ncbi:hypothetical protein [Pyrobaculum sp.]|uniref:hypothetical protein n=1 Tax=Pyrobaculum sp. TaxID=2004705 RepID=UPI003D11575F
MSTQPITVNFSKPAGYIPPGRTALYAATGSGSLSVYIGNDGSPNVTLYIELDNAISDPIPGNIGTGQYLTLTFNSYLVIYADNLSYTQELAPSIVVTGTVTPPAQTGPLQTAAPAFFGFDLSSLLNMMIQFMFLAMFIRMMNSLMSAFK